MSSVKTPVPVPAGTESGRRKPGVDTAILAGWIAGLLILAGLMWVLTQPVRNRFLVRAVNEVLEQRGDSRRVEVMSGSPPAGYFGMGSWYTMTPDPARSGASDSERTRVFIFSFLGGGSFFPCAAVMTPEGRVGEFIPLNSYGVRMLSRISPGIVNIYARRIEGIKP